MSIKLENLLGPGAEMDLLLANLAYWRVHSHLAQIGSKLSGFKPKA